ncbi:MAG: AAA family ATPase [Cyclobacteriaceae bacterium]
MEKIIDTSGSQATKIAITGPESTGKSTLSAMLAAHYNTKWVPEYAREYLEELNQPYSSDDLVKILHGQMKMEDQLIAQANRLLICDTEPLVVKIWHEVRFGKDNETIDAIFQHREYGLYLLTDIDIPWTFDPLREHPDKREYLFNKYLNMLEHMNKRYIIVSGEHGQRMQTAISAIDKYLKQLTIT